MASAAEVIPGQLMFDDPTLTPSPAVLAEAVPAPAPAAAPMPDRGAASTAADETDPDATAVGQLPSLAVAVIRSTKRRKTAQARMVGSTVEIRIPARCSADEERELVEHFRAKFERSRGADTIDLAGRAAELAQQHDLPEPATIRWVSNQQHRWGSCTPSDRSIRLSNRMVGFPAWVIDYVIVHELAHLRIPRHDAEFWALVDRYRLTERARGFLMAKSWNADDDCDHEARN